MKLYFFLTNTTTIIHNPYLIDGAVRTQTIQMLTQMFQDVTGTGEEEPAPQIEKKQSSKAGGKTARRGKRD